MYIQAHRGFSDIYPENTTLAFQKAYETGCYGIEVDIRKTVDGEYVILHDTTVDRTTDGTGAVANLSFDYIRSLDAGGWLSPEFANREDCKVPTLIEVLDIFNGFNVILILHINISNVDDVKAIIDVIVSKNMAEQVHIFGVHAVINVAKAYNPSLFTLNSGGKFLETYQTDLDNAIVNNHNCVSINAGNSLNDLKTMVDNIHSHGKLVHVSYLSGSYEVLLDSMVVAGVDFVLGNNPQIMHNYINNPSDPVTILIKDNHFVKTQDGLIRLCPFVKTVDGLMRCKTHRCE